MVSTVFGTADDSDFFIPLLSFYRSCHVSCTSGAKDYCYCRVDTNTDWELFVVLPPQRSGSTEFMGVLVYQVRNLCRISISVRWTHRFSSQGPQTESRETKNACYPCCSTSHLHRSFPFFPLSPFTRNTTADDTSDQPDRFVRVKPVLGTSRIDSSRSSRRDLHW